MWRVKIERPFRSAAGRERPGALAMHPAAMVLNQSGLEASL